MGSNGETLARTPRGKRQELARWCYRAGVLPAARAWRSLARREVRVLAYHRVLDIGDGSRFEFDPALISASPERFREQMTFVRDRMTPIAAADLVDSLESGRALPRDAVLVTFDDGYDDNYRIAFPILKELGVPATFFVSTGHIDSGAPYAYDWLVHMISVTGAKELDVPEVKLRARVPDSIPERHALAAELLDAIKWLEDAAQGAIIARLEREWSLPRAPHPDCRPMTWDQIREMHAAGMEIGSHGVHHRMLARLPAPDMAAEVAESQATLTRELGAPAATLSYPVGGPNAYGERVIAAVREAGFQVAFTYISGSNPVPVGNRYALLRLPVEYGMDIGWFAGVVAWPELFSYPTRLRIG